MTLPLLPTLRAALQILIAATLTACGNSVSPAAPVATPPTIAPGLAPRVYDRIAPDSTQRGPFTAMSRDYHFGRITVTDEVSGARYESDVHGIAWMPQNLPAGLKLPVLVWLHGRHQTCQTALVGAPLTGVGDDDCPTGLVVIETAASYTG